MVHHEEDTYSNTPVAKYCGNNSQKASAGRDEHRPPPFYPPRTSRRGDTYWQCPSPWSGAAAILGGAMDGDGCDSDLEVGGERGASSAASTVAAAAAAVVAAAAAS